MTDKQRSNVYGRFGKRLPVVFDWIDRSFLTPNSKQMYGDLITDRAQRLGL
ncbi:hypothetical protein [Spirosoma utsteinense]|uniref:Uncharacterized protein n=1 Tax=Spirosoma utsteinense TaxID=2585773 RepID=A0ABR6VZX2_9BACT|nr:hypothetical protein [Spirosoma utsteinense]MBC3786522.1 hypothetical protein [Spirosoma utsteinense]MBC3789899.1 hypothetical protein [Spirosoma utsteinense]